MLIVGYSALFSALSLIFAYLSTNTMATGKGSKTAVFMANYFKKLFKYSFDYSNSFKKLMAAS